MSSDTKRHLDFSPTTQEKNKQKKTKTEIIDDDGDEEKNEGEFTNDNEVQEWARPRLVPINPEEHDITFQQVDIDTTKLDTPLKGMPGSKVGPVPIIRLYGVTSEGHSVTMKVHGFCPYFYVNAPQGFEESDCEKFIKALEARMKSAVSAGFRADTYILQAEFIKRETIMYYHEREKQPFIKIFLLLPKHVPTARGILEQGLEIPGFGHRIFQTYESNIQFVLRFMIDRKMQGCNWITVEKGKYRLAEQIVTSSQIEIDVADGDFTCHPFSDGQYSKIAPLRILSFDIECAGRKGHFPEADKDPVIQIANLVTIQGQNKPFAKNVFTFRKTSPIVGAQVLAFPTEKEMLLEWRNFVRKVDPDVIIGYNIYNFDMPYMVERAQALNADQFLRLGKVNDSKARVKDTKFSSKAYGTRENKETLIEGRVQLDLLQVIQREHKLRSYTLNNVSAEFLGEQKEEVHYSIISSLWDGTPDERRRLAVYCLKDAYLPQRLLDKLMIMVNTVEMARVTGTPLNFLLSRGQQIRVLSQLYRKALEEELLIPTYKIVGTDEKYEGAIVVEPKRGFYDQPISTLDFTSLYPSIMIAHNLCYSTLLTKNDIRNMDPADYEKTPAGDYFVRVHKRRGILPKILEELLAARKVAKNALAKETDPTMKSVLDGRQLALKVSANSVYGFTGATVGKLPCLEISAGVTSFGREMLELTKKLVEEKYTIANGYSHNAEVIYGDTDSVMVKFGVSGLQEAMRLGKEAAKEITTHFVRPINLDFEKCYYPYLLINKKRYAGLLWTKIEKYDKMDTKGIETVRRDNCALVRNVISTCLDKILIHRDIKGAQDYTKSLISDLLQNKLDLSLLVISKSLSKDGSEYAAKQAHVELAERMRKRNPHTAPAIGDRVPYVIVQGSKGAKAYEKAEDPLWVLENNLSLDYQYYLTQQLQKPLTRIFEPIMKDPQELLTGEHTRSISMPTPSIGGIVGFIKRTKTCLGCKTPLPEGDHSATCKNCKHREGELYQKQLSLVTGLENKFNRAWTQCQRCTGTLHQEVLCSNRDCPIFYMRTKVAKDLEDAQTSLERFELVDW